MYLITIALKMQDDKPLVLKTETRNLARATIQLCKENELACEVTEEVKPRTVKFKGVD